MAGHRYKVGQTVTVVQRGWQGTPPGSYTVVRLLPPEAADNQYRLKSRTENYERVVRESELA